MQTKVEDVAGLKKHWEVEGLDFNDVAAFTCASDSPRALSRAIQSLMTEDQPRGVRLALEIAKRCFCPCCGNCFYHSDKRYYARKMYRRKKGERYVAVAEYRCANKESELRGKVTKSFVTCEHWRCEKLFWRAKKPDGPGTIVIPYWEDEQPYPRRKRAFENGEDNGEYFIASDDDLPLY